MRLPADSEEFWSRTFPPSKDKRMIPLGPKMLLNLCLPSFNCLSFVSFENWPRLATSSTQGWLQGGPGTHTGSPQPSKIIGKTRFFTKTTKKQSFVIKARTSSKLGWHAGKTANKNIFVTQKIWPRQVRRQLNWSSRVGESSIFNILKETSQQNNVGSQLQFFEDVSCENAVFYYSSTVFF